ncbi:hypothetical protein ACFQ7F_13080 [Streptomyces sp. NPDC056486]|uniref:hypothetical protein n=1 Tax=Streptomyces sp. NPDC056486 TaxID=3345835 RepID=UPI0036C2987C
MAIYRLPQGGTVHTTPVGRTGTEFVTHNADGDVIASVTHPFGEAQPLVKSLRALDSIACTLRFANNLSTVIGAR